MKNKGLLSLGITAIFCMAIFGLWVSADRSFDPNPLEMTDEAGVQAQLAQAFAESDEGIDTARIGLYVDSLAFQSPNDVYLSGYVWQQFDDSTQDIRPGIIFPEAVGGVSPGGMTMEERYRIQEDGKTTVGWYFETNLRQNFDYAQYPLDHKRVWIRVWPADFNTRLVLLPDLDAYDATGYDDVFGVCPDIVLSGWQIIDTYYDYALQTYTTDFGLGQSHPRGSLPELEFNIVLQRDFQQAFFSDLILIVIIMILLFGMILLLKSDRDKMEGSFGLSVSGAIATASGLFFSVLLAHISVRERFGGSIVYVEYFYYLAYVFILLSTALVYFFMKQDDEGHHLYKSEASLVKLLYWPVYTGIMLMITWLVL